MAEWLDRLLRRKPKETRWASTLNGYAPIYSQFGTNIYASDVVQQALRCIVSEMMKLKPQHIRTENNDPVPIMNSTVQDVLRNPNPLMTTAEFLEKITWLLLLNYNAFVIPIYYTWQDKRSGAERRYYEALYPINPANVDFIEDAAGRLFVTFTFRNGSETTMPYDDVIHIRYNYSVSDYMGGDETGQPDNKPLLSTLQLNAELLKGVAKAMKSSYAVNGIVKYNTMMDEEKMKTALAEFENKINNSESGFLGIDFKQEFTPIEKRIALIDEPTLKFIDEKILRNFGVPLAILSGDFTKEQYNAFYQKTLEPIIIAVSQAFTKKLFTRREQAFGNRVELYPEDLIFMNTDQTIEMVTLLSNTGALYENEKRVFFGLRPLPELTGKRYTSLNWIDANDASAYQIGQKETQEGKEE